MKKRISIVLVAIIIGSFALLFNFEKSIKKTDSIITDKNGQVIELISGDNDNIGH